MANNFQKIKNGLNLQPTAAPASPQDGDVWHDPTQGLMVRTAGASQQAGAPAAAQSSPAGSIIMFAGTTEPVGWVFCYGQAVSRTTFASLFAALSTTYGPGDGSTTFNLPDMRGRAPVGRDNMGGSTASRITAAISGITGTTLGATGGNEALHAHNHSGTGLTVSGTNGTSAVTGTTNIGHTHGGSSVSGSIGGDGAHTHSVRINGYSGGANMTGAVYGSSQDNNDGFDTGLPPGTPEGAHSHGFSLTAAGQSLGTTNVGLASGVAAAQSWSGTVAGSTASSGAGGSQNVQPSIIINFIIKT